MKNNNSLEIFIKNLEALLRNDPKYSMRKLSTDIGASDSYIQKVLNRKTSLSVDKVDSICDHYEVEAWEMFFTGANSQKEVLAIIQILHRFPEDALPIARAYLEYLDKYFRKDLPKKIAGTKVKKLDSE